MKYPVKDKIINSYNIPEDFRRYQPVPFEGDLSQNKPFIFFHIKNNKFFFLFSLYFRIDLCIEKSTISEIYHDPCSAFPFSPFFEYLFPPYICHKTEFLFNSNNIDRVLETRVQFQINISQSFKFI